MISSSLPSIFSRVENLQQQGNGWIGRCPAHEDRTPSLSIDVADSGKVLVKCHAGCEMNAIVEALGGTPGDLMPEQSDWQPPPSTNGRHKQKSASFPTEKAAIEAYERKLGKRSREWIYHDADNKPVGVISRWDSDGKKTIRQASRVGNGWHQKAMPEPRPLYRLPSLPDAEVVFVCEGEKATDAVHSIGLVATCSAGGSSAPSKTDWSPLAGKTVYILPDCDVPGEKYAREVSKLLNAAGVASVKTVRLPGLKTGEDAVEWIGTFGDAAEPDSIRAELMVLCGQAEPEPPVVEIESYQPFPVHCLPDPIRCFVEEGANAIGCDPAYIALPALSVLASAIGSTRRLQVKRDWRVPSILWTAIVGESGTQKSPAFRLATEPLKRSQARALEAFREMEVDHERRVLEYEKKLAEWKREKTADDPPIKPTPPEPERMLVSDATVEALAPILGSNPRGVLLLRDELAGWLGSFDQYKSGGRGGADRAHWLSLFDGDCITVDRKSGTPKTIHVPHAYVSITGGIQPGVLSRSLNQEDRESGLAARMLFASPPRKSKRWSEDEVSPETEAEYAETVDRLLALKRTEDSDGNPEPVLLQLFPDAKDSWIDFYERHGKELAGLDGDIAAAWSKLEQIPARLAIVIHCVKDAADDEGFVTAETMREAIELTEWFKREARRLYGMLGESQEDRERRSLIELIERNGGRITARELARKSRKYRAAGVAEESLMGLVSDGFARRDVDTKTGGAPRNDFVLVTVVTEA